MGKTIMLSALIQTSLPSGDVEDQESNVPAKIKQLKLNSAFRAVDQRKPTTSKPPSATLIVAPTSLLNQWAEELERSSKPGTLTIFIWHGTNRSDLEALIEDGEDEEDKTLKIVITSYGVLASEHAKMDRLSTKALIFESLFIFLNVRGPRLSELSI
jgi:DNA repair protein RAD5